MERVVVVIIIIIIIIIRVIYSFAHLTSGTT